MIFVGCGKEEVRVSQNVEGQGPRSAGEIEEEDAMEAEVVVIAEEESSVVDENADEQQEEDFEDVVVEELEDPTEIKPMTGWNVYKGKWFDIQYPNNFTPDPPQATTKGGRTLYDHAFFNSPDGKISFYVFAPLWDIEGVPAEIAISDSEYLASEKKVENQCQKIVWETKIANDGSYFFSTVDEISSPDMINCNYDYEGYERHIFGIKYADKAAYNQYLEQYLHFKESLQRYAD